MVLDIYKCSQGFPKEELYGITNQIRRAVSSVTANIAEGFSRFHYKDKVNFYYQARGSLSEVYNFLILLKDLKYITVTDFDLFQTKVDTTRKLINGLIRSIDNQQKSNL